MSDPKLASRDNYLGVGARSKTGKEKDVATERGIASICALVTCCRNRLCRLDAVAVSFGSTSGDATRSQNLLSSPKLFLNRERTVQAQRETTTTKQGATSKRVCCSRPVDPVIVSSTRLRGRYLRQRLPGNIKTLKKDVVLLQTTCNGSQISALVRQYVNEVDTQADGFRDSDTGSGCKAIEDEEGYSSQKPVLRR